MRTVLILLFAAALLCDLAWAQSLTDEGVFAEMLKGPAQECADKIQAGDMQRERSAVSFFGF